MSGAEAVLRLLFYAVFLCAIIYLYKVFLDAVAAQPTLGGTATLTFEKLPAPDDEGAS